MQSYAEKPVKTKVSQTQNGLKNLVEHYQKMFDTRENLDHYSPIDYQNAKRNFVKYLLETRAYN